MTRRIVVASLEAWDGVWRRNQYLVDGLLTSDADTEVLFVEPPSDPLHDLLTGYRPRRGRGSRVGGYDGRLVLYQPTKVLPRLAGPAADALLTRGVLQVLEGLGWREGVLWINDPGAMPLVAALGWPALYDVTDDWVHAERVGRAHSRIVEADRILLERSREVVVCSPELAHTKGALRQVHLIPNAVDVERYRKKAPRPADLPENAVALYVGTLHEDRLDVDLVLRTSDAASMAGGTVVLVGPIALNGRNRERLAAHPGILMLGSREHEAVPGYLQHAHVLLVPHVVTAFTESLDPIKLYEYLAVGRPVVSTPVAGFRETKGVTIARADAFADAVVLDLMHWRPSVEYGHLPDWRERIEAFDAVIETTRAPGVASGEPA